MGKETPNLLDGLSEIDDSPWAERKARRTNYDEIRRKERAQASPGTDEVIDNPEKEELPELSGAELFEAAKRAGAGEDFAEVIKEMRLAKKQQLPGPHTKTA
ncbi:MAG TPA: hypothetical protein VF974_06710 [Patescibacteria group bacterium]